MDKWLVTMGSMFWGGEDELGKKDDDHKPTKNPSIRASWTAATSAPRRKLLKRLAIVLAVAAFVYLFIRNLPTDIPVRDRRRPVYMPQSGADLSDKPRAQAPVPVPGPMPKLKPDHKSQRPLLPYSQSSENEPPATGYSGPLKFERLLATLQAVYSTGGASAVNRNVLFAAASLKSAALLLPMACDMGLERRNYVHFVLVGGSEITLEKLRSVNGIGEHCQIMFHDARPDLAAKSTSERLRRSVTRALCKFLSLHQSFCDRAHLTKSIVHVNNYLHPQALLLDASGMEEDYFLAGMRSQAPVLGLPLIQLPEHAPSRLGWITKLDSSSLAGMDITGTAPLVQRACANTSKQLGTRSVLTS